MSLSRYRLLKFASDASTSGRCKCFRLLCVLSWLLGAVAVHPAAGQAERRTPARTDSKEQETQEVPVQESKAAPLPANKLEEALRLLLEATGDSTAKQVPQQRVYEIEGLVVDETISKVGHDFYDLFYTQFEAPPGSGEYVITILEKPGRGINTLVTLTINDNDVLEMPLQPKYDYIEAAANDAVAAALAYLQEAASVSRQLEKGARQPLETF